MRIIAGRLRSRKLVFPKNRLTRPMTDRAKETIFNILGEMVLGVRVLDLFAGSGSLGLEALSRGAGEVVFVEHGEWGLAAIRKNLECLGLADHARVLKADVFQALDRIEKEEKAFGLIFLDPPYNKGLVKKLLQHLDHSAIVTPETQIVLHRSRQENLPGPLENLRLLRDKPFGQACLSFLSGS